MNRRAFTFFFSLCAMLAACDAPQQADERPVLRVGDQLNGLRTLLEAAGEAEPSDYRIEWSNFLGGPAIIAAQTGGSLDIGFMQETPLVFAQAAGSPVRVVAAARRVTPGTSIFALVVKPDSPVHSVADLRGRSVGFMPGTVTQYVLVRMLEQAGLSVNDIRPVHLAGVSSALLKNGDVDAVITAEPYLTRQEASGDARVIAMAGEPLTADFTYLAAPISALEDPARAAALQDFVARVTRAYRWQREHFPEAAAHFAPLYQVDPQTAERILRRAPSRFTPIDPSIIARHQEEADTFLRLGLIRNRVDAGQLFDHRFDSIVAASEQSS